MKKCQYCGCEKKPEELYYGYVALTLPIREMEEKINKWGRNNWWKNLEQQNNLTEEEFKELDNICYYDQLLNTVGKGYVCVPCLQEEDKLLNEFYSVKNNK